MNTQPIFSALILSSGLSERMGQPKAFLNWDDSRTFIEKIAGEFIEAGCTQVICTVNRFILPGCRKLNLPSNVKFILNEHPEWSRLFSISLGLKELRENSYCFIHNVDNPFIHDGIIKNLLESADPGSWISPEFEGKGGHPVLLPPGIVEKVLEGNLKDATLQDILSLFPKIAVKMQDDSVLRNINTPEEYLKLIDRNT
ncbi:MAG TPA: NTP transferase domain-containing protein [Bacteroidales bacterium]|nr:NTP transferase domain-containing protein [Bacteroidales bacterium]